MAAKLASSNIMTDWGARPLSATSTLFDPLHYNNGAVWPFVTGFVSLAQYRYHNASAGRFALDAIARTTFDQSLGRNSEVISGRLYKPLDTAVPQQFFATSMVLTPLIRGLLGLDVDAPSGRVTIAPHLPPDWDSVAVENVPVGSGRISFVVRRAPGEMALTVNRAPGSAPLEVNFAPALPLGALIPAAALAQHTPGDVHPTVHAALTGTTTTLRVAYTGGWSIVPPVVPVEIGARSKAPRVLSERLDRSGGGERYVLWLEGLAGGTYEFRVRGPSERIGVEAGMGASASLLAGNSRGWRVLRVVFPDSVANADGYTAATVVFSVK
jgi:hypothetical protein